MKYDELHWSALEEFDSARAEIAYFALLAFLKATLPIEASSLIRSLIKFKLHHLSLLKKHPLLCHYLGTDKLLKGLTKCMLTQQQPSQSAHCRQGIDFFQFSEYSEEYQTDKVDIRPSGHSQMNPPIPHRLARTDILGKSFA